MPRVGPATKFGNHHPIISCMQSMVTNEDTHYLTQPFLEMEFKEASMHSDKSLSPENLNPTFYHRLWDEIEGGNFFLCFLLVGLRCLTSRSSCYFNCSCTL